MRKNLKISQKKRQKKKSKLNYLITNLKRSVNTRPAYMNKLNRIETRNIMIFRSRMAFVKCNYKNQFKDTICRWCNKTDETQKHFLEECKSFDYKEKRIEEEDIFLEDITEWKKICQTLQEIIKILEKKK